MHKGCVSLLQLTLGALQTQSKSSMSLCTHPSPVATSRPLPCMTDYLDFPQGGAGVEGPGDEGRRPRAGSAQGMPSGPTRKGSRPLFGKQL